MLGNNETFSVAGVNSLTGNFLAGILPVISLFGKDWTNVYLSQCDSWVEWFVFSVAPIGVGWAIVACLKARKNGRLHSFLGFSSLSDAETERDILSSTSDEVCEVWNGQKIIRIIGEPCVKEFMYAPKELDRGPNPGPDLQPTADVKIKRRDLLKSSMETDGRPPDDGLPPNLLQNICHTRKRSLIGAFFVSAACFCGYLFIIIATACRLLPDPRDFLVTRFSFVATIVGTVLQTVSLTLGVRLIEGGSVENIRWTLRTKDPVSLIWLQRHESYGSYVLIEQDVQDTIHSKHRRKPVGKQIPGTFYSTLAALFSLLILLGFLLQWIGLTGMKWPPQLSQLVFVIVMTGCRMIICHQREPSVVKKIINGGHEMDWLALCKELNPDYLKRRRDADKKLDDKKFEWKLCVDIDAITQNQRSASTSSSASEFFKENKAEAILKTRIKLGEYCDWHSPAHQESMKLYHAIMRAWKMLRRHVPDGAWNELSWPIEVRTGESGRESCYEIWFTMKNCSTNLEKTLEAALSLMLFHDPPEKARVRERNGPRNAREKGQKQDREKGQLLLGLNVQRVELWTQLEYLEDAVSIRNTGGERQHNDPQIRGFTAATFDPSLSFETKILEPDRSPPEHDIALPISESTDAALDALHIYSSFMWALANATNRSGLYHQRLFDDLKKLTHSFWDIELSGPEHLYWLSFAPFIYLNLISPPPNWGNEQKKEGPQLLSSSLSPMS